MSRILEFQHADEQTVVARVLLELHQAIDVHFPQAKGSSRQFSKTLLATQNDIGTAIDNQPAVAAAKAGGVAVAAAAARPSAKPAKANTGFGLEFSKPGSLVGGLTATMMQETIWSKWLTRFLLLSLFLGTVLLAWIYLFGVPRLQLP